jgi:hypothetical protein
MSAKRSHFPNIRPIDARRRKSPPAPTKKERLAAWRKFLTNDNDWSWETVLGVLAFKLGRLEQSIRHGYGGDRNARVAEIHAVREIIRRVLEDKYESILLVPHQKKYGSLRVRWEDSQNDGYVTMILEHTKAKTPAAQKAAKIASFRIADKAAKERQHDIEKLFSLIARDLQIWWD